MQVISHRGNYNGKRVENDPNLLPIGRWVCEVDLWRINNKLYLGHDTPAFYITEEWIFDNANQLLLHAKNSDALLFIKRNNLEGFFHQTDDFVLTTLINRIIVYPGKEVLPGSIVMRPELYSPHSLEHCYAVCTDYPERY